MTTTGIVARKPSVEQMLEKAHFPLRLEKTLKDDDSSHLNDSNPWTSINFLERIPAPLNQILLDDI